MGPLLDGIKSPECYHYPPTSSNAETDKIKNQSRMSNTIQAIADPITLVGPIIRRSRLRSLQTDMVIQLAVHLLAVVSWNTQPARTVGLSVWQAVTSRDTQTVRTVIPSILQAVAYFKTPKPAQQLVYQSGRRPPPTSAYSQSISLASDRILRHPAGAYSQFINLADGHILRAPAAYTVSSINLAGARILRPPASKYSLSIDFASGCILRPLAVAYSQFIDYDVNRILRPSILQAAASWDSQPACTVGPSSYGSSVTFSAAETSAREGHDTTEAQ